MYLLPETQHLVSTYKLDHSLKRILGQEPSIEKLDLETVHKSAPKDASDGADLLNQMTGKSLNYVARTDTWYCWNGIIHVPLGDKAVPLQLIDILSNLLKDAEAFIREAESTQVQQAKAQYSGDDLTKAVTRIKAAHITAIESFKKYATSLAGNKGVTDTLAKLGRIAAKPSSFFEQDNQWLVVRNGVIDLHDYRSTGKITLLDHDASRPVYRYFDAEHNAETKHDDYDTWRKFLASSIADWDTVLLLQKAVGAAFSAEQKPRALFNLLGAPASGKSVFLSVFNKLGQDYSVMPNNQAIQTNNGDTNFYQDALRGARFVGFSEVQGKKPLDDGFLKGVLGGDQQETRQIKKSPNKWKPQCVLFIASNLALKFNTRDEATFIKILPIPFPHSFTDTDPAHKMDRDLENKVLAERDGILHWVLEGMKLFWRDGLNPTAAVMAAMDGNKTANSSALQFIEQMLEAEYIIQDLDAPASACLPLGKAYEMFRAWADDQGMKNAPLKTTFNTDVADYYHGKRKSGTWTFTGLKMSAEVHSKVQTGVGLNTLALSL